jgi:hypothetical protein
VARSPRTIVVGLSNNNGSSRPPVAKNGRPEPKPSGDLVDDHLVDRPELERLAADLTGGHVDVPVPGELLGGGNGLLDAVDERERSRIGVLPVRGG